MGYAFIIFILIMFNPRAFGEWIAEVTSWYEYYIIRKREAVTNKMNKKK